MGCFVKDTLYRKKDDRQPQGAAGINLYRDRGPLEITARPGQAGIPRIAAHFCGP